MKIYRPGIQGNEKEVLQLRAMLNQPKHKMLCKALNFLYTIQPAKATDLLELISKYYKQPYDKSTIYESIRKLKCLGLVEFERYDEAIHMNGKIHKEVIAKHREYLRDNVTKNFWDKMTKIKYYWLTKKGESLIEWTCKVLGFEAKNG